MRWGLLFVAFLAITSTVNADIIDWNCGSDGDGGIDMSSAAWADLAPEGGIPAYELRMDTIQNESLAHMEGDFITDTELDPIVWLIEDVDNNTGFTWTGYQFYVYMTKSFSINAVMAPEDWSYQITAPIAGQVFPHQEGEINPVTGWMGLISFTADNPAAAILDGGMGSFGAKLAFIGTVQFCTEQIPTPEPATLGILGLGALGLLRRK